jgi:hypothetical protein
MSLIVPHKGEVSGRDWNWRVCLKGVVEKGYQEI